jgi:hypothetical protein
MNTDKATSRPWVSFAPHSLSDSLRIFSGTHYIGTIGNSDDPIEVTNSNAALIVKAVNLFDDLVKVLEDILWELPIKRDWLDPDIEKIARDLVAKAKE